jgi:predicted NodU family carbamoyl transferase
MTQVSVILGIGGALGHNAALLVDGRLVSASQEERFTRIKDEWNFPCFATLGCLNSTSLGSEQIEPISDMTASVRATSWALPVPWSPCRAFSLGSLPRFRSRFLKIV